MAVHLNARLNTRFIPYLIGSVAFVILVSSLAHASDASGDLGVAGGLPAVTREELQAVLSESVDASRIDRSPGFSPITVAPRPGERPTTGSLTARKDEEPAPGGASSSISTAIYLDDSDELPAQPAEAYRD